MYKPITDIVIYAPSLSVNGKKQVYTSGATLVGLVDTNGDPILDGNGAQLTEWMYPVTDKCERSAVVMGDDYVRLSFELATRVQFAAFSFIEYNGQTFFLRETYRPKNNGTYRDSSGVMSSHYTYDMRFVSLGNMLTKHTCLRNVVVVNETWNEPEININGTLETLYTMMIGSIEQAALRIRDERQYYRQCLLSLVANKANAKLTPNTDLVTFSFSGAKIADCLTTIANGYDETEWFITENNGSFTLNIAKHEDTDASIIHLSDEYYENTGADKDERPTLTGGLTSCEYAQEWNGIVQRITPFGSDRNMVKQTGVDSNTEMMVSYGKRLRLDPSHKVRWRNGMTFDEWLAASKSGTTFGTLYPSTAMRRRGTTGCYVVKAKDGKAVLLEVDKDGAVTNPDTNVDTGIEEVLMYDDVYPQCHFKVTSVEEKTKRIDGELQPRYTIEGVAVDENEYPKSVLANLGMFPIKIIEAQTLSVVFESGLLNGREFEITNKTTKDEGVTEYSLCFTIVADGDITEGTLIPSGNFIPKVGDKFALFNMKMPQEFIDMARDELAQKAYDDLIELENTRPEVKCVADEDIFEQYDIYLGRRCEVTSEIFVSDAHFISRVISYSYPLSAPSRVSFSLASAIMEGTISSIESSIGEQTGQIGGLNQRAINLSRRGWHDASEMVEMLDGLTTPMMLVGVEKNQFQYTSGIQCVNGRMNGNIDHFDHLQIGNGVLQHTQKDWIDWHEGRWYIEPVDDLHLCNNGNESINSAANQEKPYYLYAFCQENSDYAQLKLYDMDYAAAHAIEEDVHYLLLGILSSEFEDTDNTAYRVFNRSNGYTQIAGGTITTEVLQDPTRSLIIDMASNPPRIIARNNAQIIGNIQFKLEEDEHFQSALERILGVENFVEDFEVGGRNYVLLSDDEISTNGAKEQESKNFAFSFDTADLLPKLRGKKVTLSLQVDMKNAGASSTGTYHRAGFEPSIVFKDGSVQYLGLWQMLSANPKTTFSGRISKTFKIEDKEIDHISQRGIYIQNVASGTIKLSRPKFEFGTMATDWTPAPEDAENAIAAAQARADAAMQNLSDMASDSKLTPQEKIDLKREWLEIQSEYTKNRAQAVTYDVSTSDYDNAYNALKAYLVGAGTSVAGLIGIGGAVNNAQMNATSDINSTTFTNKFKAYYDANIDLLNAISNAINERAGESGQNLIGEVNPYTIKAEATNNYNWWSLVGKFGTSTRGAAVNQTWLENGKEYTFVVDKAVVLAGSATKFSAGLYNGSTTNLQIFDIKDSKQRYKFTVPSDGTNWGFIIYPAKAGETGGISTRFTNLALYEGSHSPDFYKEYIKHITDALHGTTEVSGGMVMTNVIMLKGTDGQTRAGMSGLEDDNVLLWADADANKGSYANALAQSKKNATEIGKDDITTLFKKDGTAKLGVFSIDNQKARVKVYSGSSVTGIIDIDAASGMKIYQGGSATDDNLKICVVNDNISNYAPIQPTSASGSNGTLHVWTSLQDDFGKNKIMEFTLEQAGNVNFTNLYIATKNNSMYVSATRHGSILNGVTVSTKYNIVIVNSSGTRVYTSPQKSYSATTGSTAPNLSASFHPISLNLAAGKYKVYLLFTTATVGGQYGSESSGYVDGVFNASYSYTRTYSYKQKTTIGIDGLITAVSTTRFFEVLNTSTEQKIIMAGIGEEASSTEKNRVIISKNPLKSFGDNLKSFLHNYIKDSAKKSGFSAALESLIAALPDSSYLTLKQ